MATTMHVDIVSAEAEIFSGTAEMLTAQADDGEVGIMPRHAAYLARLRPGEVTVTLQGGERQGFYVSGGMLEVQPHVATVLADTAVRAKDLDEAQAIQAKEAAEKAMADQKDKIDYAKAQAELVEAAAKLQTIQRMRSRGS